MRLRSPLNLLLLIGIVASCALIANREIVSAGSNPSPAPVGVGSSSPINVDKLDPSIDQIIPAGAMLERVATGYTWTEGPVWVKDTLFFADIPGNSILKWTEAAGASVFLNPSGYKGSVPYEGPEPGSNGMTLDSLGRLTVAGHAQRNVFRLESLDPGAKVTILADSYQGKQLNSPNDLVYSSDGALYFTDPPYGLRTQKDNDPDKKLTVNGVYRLPHALSQKPGAAPARAKLQLLVSDLTRPNGIAFSPDEKFLYVDNSEPKKLWLRYRVQPDGTLLGTGPFFVSEASQSLNRAC